MSGRPGGRASASAPTRAAANCVVVAGQVASSEAHSERAKKRSHLATVASSGAPLAGEWGLFRAVCVSLIFGTSCAIVPAYFLRVGTELHNMLTSRNPRSYDSNTHTQCVKEHGTYSMTTKAGGRNRDRRLVRSLDGKERSQGAGRYCRSSIISEGRKVPRERRRGDRKLKKGSFDSCDSEPPMSAPLYLYLGPPIAT